MKIQDSDRINYSMISLFQYIFSILVILLHAQRIFSNDVLHFVQKSIFSRMAVPFFLLTTSFFIKLNEKKNSGGVNRYIKKASGSYFRLSLLYLPYALLFFLKLKLSILYLPLGFIFAIIYSGMCYHLWYFPASFFGLKFTTFLSNKTSRKNVLIICLILYLIGSIETYSAYLSDTKLFEIYEVYKQYFLTTRNGLFYVPIFIFLGQLAFDYRNNTFFMSYPLIKLFMSFIVLLLEAGVIYLNQGDDKNFIISLIPFTLFLFNWVSRTNLFKQKDWYRLKLYSVAYFFFHPIFIEIGFYIIDKSNIKNWEKGLFVSIFTLIFTHTITLIFNKKKR